MADEPKRVERPGLGICPRCGQNVARGEFGYTTRERDKNGLTFCGGCGELSPTRKWVKEP